MQPHDFSTSFSVSESPEQVFNAVTNVRGWWSEQIEGRTDALNEEFDYHYQDVHRCKMKIVEFAPARKVVWLVEDNYFNFVNDKTEWKNTEIHFEIIRHDAQTELIFTHKGLVPAYECYSICADSWGNYIRGSLKDLIVKGKGNPNPYQTAIENAEKKKNQTEADKSFTESFLIDKAPATVFNAINQVDKWWCTELKGSSAKVGDEFEVKFGDLHYSRHRVVVSFPFKQIVWLVTDSDLSFSADPQEWTGTKNIFEIEAEEGKTRLTFTHEGLQPDLQCFSNCVQGWKYYLEASLLPYISEGKGNPGK